MATTGLRRLCFALALGLAASACVANKTRTTPPAMQPELNDPFEGVNRKVYQFNDRVDRAVVEPVTSGYRRVTPEFVRDRIRNFADNLRTPVWIVNETLQADFADAGDSTGRFVINTTLGIGGLFDVADRFGYLEQRQEDFGQTLAVYGVPEGPYIIIPFGGPTTLRDAAGSVVDFAFNPLTWINFDGRDATRTGVNIASAVDTRSRVTSFLEQVRDSAEPYSNLRAVYAQAREAAIHEDADPLENLPDFE